MDDWEGPKGQRGPYYAKPYTTHRRFIPGLCKRAGIKSFGFHALRRYVASILREKDQILEETNADMLDSECWD